jgi:iron-only hydrogenase group A
MPRIPLDSTAPASVTIEINGKKCAGYEGESVLDIALRSGIDIPHFCTHPDLPVDANCRTCLVETEDGMIVTSCSLKAVDGMNVKTDTPTVIKLRTQNMELLFGKYKHKSFKSLHGYWSKTLEELKRYGISGDTYKRDDPKRPIHKLGTAAEFDPSLCIACNKCVEICQLIGICHLTLEGKGSKTRVGFNKDASNDCIYCGQCTAHCPVEAIREQSHLVEVEKALKDKTKIVIAQMAPSVRNSVGEGFGVEYGKDLTPQLCTAFRMLGFSKVFDVNMGADITTMVEAEELVERLTHKWEFADGKRKDAPVSGPMFTSCCPGWVKFVEFYEPGLIPNLTTSSSPQIHSGGAYKTWWAEREGIDPKNIVVVSLMPCTSKKYEAKFDHLKIDGHAPVDYVLTTRELISLLKTRKIDLPNLKPGSVDREGTYSGAAAIYGASGGVMESALRTAYKMATGGDLPGIDFTPVRGFDGLKKASVKIGAHTVNLAVAAMPKNIRPLLREIKKNPDAYDYIEVMACPGGCIGGGGQPIPNTFEIVKKRIAGLYSIDKKMNLRRAHDNPVVKEFFEYLKTVPTKKREALLYRGYERKRKGE